MNTDGKNGNVKTQKRPSIIQYKDKEIQEYEENIQAFRQGKIPEMEFMAYRLRLGVYGGGGNSKACIRWAARDPR